MFDSSLNMLTPHEWPFSIDFSRRLVELYPRIWAGEFSTSIYASQTMPQLKLYNRVFNSLNPYSDYHYRRMYRSAPKFGIGPRLMAASARAKENSESLTEVNFMSTSDEVEQDSSLSTEMENAVNQPSASTTNKLPTLRSNFSETAFFYPSLTSNGKGEVELSFTLPESMTEWTFMGLAHSKDMRYGFLKSKIQARKDFMVQPNVPRFVRENDQLTIATRIINLSDKDQSGQLTLRLLDANSEREVYRTSQPFSALARQTIASPSATMFLKRAQC
jgi:hypothetical protein